MIKMKDGTTVYFRGEWNAQSRHRAVYEARKLGGTPSAKIVGSALIVWPSRPLKVHRAALVETVTRIKDGMRNAVVEAHAAAHPRVWQP